MTWLYDIFLFLLVPGLVVVVFLITYRGNRLGYKIVKETNSLGEIKYELWFEYYSIHGTHGWLLENTFDTEEQVNECLARLQKTREVIKEGKLNEVCSTKQ